MCYYIPLCQVKFVEREDVQNNPDDSDVSGFLRKYLGKKYQQIRRPIGTLHSNVKEGVFLGRVNDERY